MISFSKLTKIYRTETETDRYGTVILKPIGTIVYTITGEKFGMFIDRKLSGHNFNLHLIGSAKKGCVKRILQFSLDNGWSELDHARVQPPSSLGLEVRPRMLNIEKIIIC